MIDYTIYFRENLPLDSEWGAEYDIFISAYNASDRVIDVFNRVRAKKKIWILHKEYEFVEGQYPDGVNFVCGSDDEADCILSFSDAHLEGRDITTTKICIDITGLMRPHLAFFIMHLYQRGFTKIDAIYSEPSHYKRKENTQFSSTPVHKVRQVAGFEGVMNNDNSNDLLIIGAGYESDLIADVADEKDKAKKIVLLGLPSLRADMYQQNAWRAQQASDSIGESTAGKVFAPANDPFVTASVLSELVAKREMSEPITNLYLSPIATKAQTLGFVLFFLGERQRTSTSLIFPFSQSYARDSATGISRVWLYTLEFPFP